MKMKEAFLSIEASKSGWVVRTFQRQYNFSLYGRMAFGRNKEAVLELVKEENAILQPTDIVKQPMVLEFLGMEKKQSIQKWLGYFMLF